MKRPPILILHGWSLSGDRYTPFIQELSQMGYAAYAPDLPGFGKTSLPKKPLHLSDYVEFVEIYIKKHSLIDPIIIGHSFGGRIALKYTYLHSDLVRGLILTGTPGFSSLPDQLYFLGALGAKVGGWIFSFTPLKRMKEYIRNGYYFLIGSRDFFRAEGTMKQTLKNIVAEKVVDYMKHIMLPVTLIWGEDDVICPITVAHKMHKAIFKSKEIIIPNGRHCVIYQNPRLFASYVDQFIQSL